MKKLALVIAGLVAGVLLAEVAARSYWYHKYGPHPLALMNVVSFVRVRAGLTVGPDGPELNAQAWEASYRERNLPVPAGGPREGYHCTLVAWDKHPIWGWQLRPTDLPGKFKSDAKGLQTAGPEQADVHLLVVGGSVAMGLYASSITNTYFSRLQELLSRPGRTVRLTIMAAGAWTSVNELPYVCVGAAALRPDAVLVIDGLNDLTEPKTTSFESRVSGYLENMATARDVVTRSSIPVIFAWQPYLPTKKVKSPLEQRIMELPPSSPRLVRAFTEMQAGVSKWQGLPKVHLIDCTGVFDEEKTTTFADFWHFSDPGHELLAQHLARQLGPIIESFGKGK
jgi:hypothetical protein